MGPMKAAGFFLRRLGAATSRVSKVTATVFGSLAWTGKGHATDMALVLGLAGEVPDSLDPDHAHRRFAEIKELKKMTLPDGREISFDPVVDIVFDYFRTFERHSNAMRFEALDETGKTLSSEVWFSIGGGFAVRDGESDHSANAPASVPYLYTSGQDLLELCDSHGLSIAQIGLANEIARSSKPEALAAADRIAGVMFACIDRGLATGGTLPGALQVQRRAKGIYDHLQSDREQGRSAPNEIMDYVSVFAIAVNEENAAGGRVVTAPTNGAAGVVPAVLRYYRDFCRDAGQDGIRTFLFAATAIGGIIKRNASISGAEVGCQGEVGSSAAMAAAGLAAALGATNAQIENAAEIAMEHHLGMTCDPIGGLVQIPCIERNAFGAIKAISAASLSMRGDGTHVVSLDQVIETMRQTGVDMQSKYKETSQGGLAVNVTEC